MQHVYVKSVLRILTEDCIYQEGDAADLFLQWVQEADLLSKFIPGDKSWVMACEPELVL